MPFLTPVAVTVQTTTATLTAPLVYQGRDDTFTVPTGTSTDFASVPRFMTWLIPTMGAYTRAAVLHDYLCGSLEFTRNLRREGHQVTFRPLATARDTDGLFRRVCREAGTPLVRRWLLWAGVRWGALFTPARRVGWIRDAPKVLAISAVALPFLLLPALFVGLTLLVDRVVECVR